MNVLSIVAIAILAFPPTVRQGAEVFKKNNSNVEETSLTLEAALLILRHTKASAKKTYEAIC